MSICFIAAGPITWASSRLRCFWPAEYMDATVIPYASLRQTPLPPSTVYIWQKHVSLDLIAQIAHAQHWWDISEPVWWFDPDRCRKIISHMSGFVASTEALAAEFMKWSGRFCHVIPDRLEPRYFTQHRTHAPVQPVRLIWFGSVINRVALTHAWPNLMRLNAEEYNVELTIMDDRPDLPLRFGHTVRVYHARWAWERDVTVMASHDIALLPPIPGPLGQMRSPYKQLMAWACRLPVTDGQDYDDLCQLVTSHQERERRGAAGQQDVLARWAVGKSAGEWLALLFGAS
ncbi:MAG: hypothetical protein IAE79_23800 [Anaerolinea sp.]|nr:hypothetical protein [Anaerolinea sp.]